MLGARAGYAILLTGTITGEVTVALVGGIFLVGNTLLQARIAASVERTRRLAEDNSVKITDVHAMSDKRGKDRRKKQVRISHPDRRRDTERRRNADS